MKTFASRIKESEEQNTELLEAIKIKKKDMQVLFKQVFSSEEGEKVLNILVDAYVVPAIPATMAHGEVMYCEGQTSVIKMILSTLGETK